MPEPIVREASFTDIPKLIPLLRMEHDEVGLWPWHEASVMKTVLDCLEHGVVIVVDLGGELIASIAVLEMTATYSTQKFFNKVWFFVHPEHRRGAYARMLLRVVIDWSISNGHDLLAMNTTTKQTEAKDKMMGAHMTPVGQVFLIRALQP